MTESLFSSSWYRVADLKPRLRSHARVLRHHYRGQHWYVVQDGVSGRHHRFSSAAHAILGLMNGRRAMQEIWEAASARLGDDAPTQDQVIGLLGHLHAADLLQCDVAPDTLELFQRFEKQQSSLWKRKLANPLSARFPLLDPEAWLRRGLPFVRPLFSGLGAIVWLGVVGTGLVLAVAHWGELSANVADRVLTSQNLLLLWIVYPLVKALHEFGHAFATRVWGGEVHEMGIVLLVLVPVPYVDASAASAFPEKHRRVLVGAAGMMVELFLAALALFVWLEAEAGWVRALAYNVMLIGGVSTLFFNANPLLRFDGYYMLADGLDIPNLSGRANRHLAYLAERHLFGVDDAVSPANAPGERGWFLFYGVAAFAYRIVLTFVIALFVAGKLFFVGVALALWALTSQVLLPLLRMGSYLLASPRLRRRRLRALATSALVAGAVAGLLFAWPMPLRTRSEGVVWLPEHAQVRAAADGFVLRLLALPDADVRRGEPLIETEDPLLAGHVRLLEAQLRELRVRHTAAWRTDQGAAELLKGEIAVLEADLARARERSDQLLIRSPADGTFVVPWGRNLPGRFLKQGETVAYVADLADATARVVVTQDQIGLVRERTRGVAVRRADRPGVSIPARLAREVPAGSDRLPSAVLGRAGGGRIPVDPEDTSGTKALETVFQFDLAMPESAALGNVGGRLHVRFEHGSEPLARQSYRRVRQLFLRRFGV